MSWQYTPYVLPLLIIAAIVLALAYYTRRRSAAPSAIAFVVMMVAVAEWSLGYALELGAPDLAAKTFWAKIEYLGIVTLPLAWLAFCPPLHSPVIESWSVAREISPCWL